MGTFSFPSKTFLLGEYAVINEGVGLMLAHGPSFTAEVSESSSSPAFHQACAAGKAAGKLGVDLSTITFRDPHQGKGGFGGSGAEFLSVVAAASHLARGEEFAWRAWDLYKSLNCTGSGADIVTQGAGSPGKMVALHLKQRRVELFPAGTLGLQVTLFHTGHKLPTHQHLQNAGKLDTQKLAGIAEAGIESCRAKSPANFLACIKEYAAELSRMQLVAPHAASALEGLHKVEQVLAAKGCGALGSDVLLVCTQGRPDQALATWAGQHSLVEVASLPI